MNEEDRNLEKLTAMMLKYLTGKGEMFLLIYHRNDESELIQKRLFSEGPPKLPFFAPNGLIVSSIDELLYDLSFEPYEV